MTRRRGGDVVTASVGAIAVAVLAAAVGCGGSGSAPSPGQKALASQMSDYGKDYSNTTCQQFLGQLTDGQRTAAAAEALIRLRRDDQRPAPSDNDVAAFKAGITGACEAVPTDGLVQTAASVYLREHS